MSQQNVELVRSALKTLASGDRDAYVDDYCAENVEARPDLSRFTEAEPLRGRAEFRRFLAETDESWEGGSSLGEIEELFLVGDRVVVEFFFDHARALKAAGLSE
jgi:ketosteroid isomerase-like protein